MTRGTTIGLIIGILILAGLVWWYVAATDDTDVNVNIPIQSQTENRIIYTTDMEADEAALRDHCLAQGGVFNTCGSLCDPGEVCAQVCAFSCELPSSSTNGDNDNENQWQTYSADNNSYTVQYRRDMQIDENQSRVNFMLKGPTQEENTELFDGVNFTVMGPYEYDKDETLKDLVDTEVSNSRRVGTIEEEPTITSLDGFNGYTYATITAGTLSTNYILGLDANTALRVFYSTPDPENQGYEAMAERMLNSLDISDTADWDKEDDIVRLHNPRPLTRVQSPLTISGEARGNWFFEASFPIELQDANGATIKEDFIMTSEEWMTENFVSFEKQITFTAPQTDTGFLILHKDNPSGLPENEDELRILVRFR
ncbi:MAG: Gmad2 immunoglobulin-like domain-containing protein [Candidatus Komeilibacteria bacterium]|nr:Gmad2 immunoglobulin-like domain-containing protein [Candidatus Komeilibacteria bacterium]